MRQWRLQPRAVTVVKGFGAAAGIGVLLVCVVVGLAAAGPVSAEVIFASNRCDQGGTPPNAPTPAGSAACVSSIWKVGDAGGNAARLTDGGVDALSGDGQPAWSPDGTRIAFARAAKQTSGASRLWVMNADGSGQHALSPPGPAGVWYDDENPIWAPTGLMLAFDSNRPLPGQPPSPDKHVWLMNVDGSGLHPLTSGAGSDRVPRFSPDGLRVIFLHGEGIGQTSSVESVLLDGAARAPVTEGTLQLGPWALSFSPDGRRIALDLYGGIYAINSDGSGLTRLSMTSANEITWAATPPALFYSAISPSGHGLAIFRLALDATGGVRQITDGPSFDNAPSWNPLTGLGLPLPIPGVTPPVVTIPPLPPVASARTRARAGALDSQPRIPYLAVDPAGIRWIRAAIARVSRGTCRFLIAGTISKHGSCRHPHYYFAVPDTQTWRGQTDPLPTGRYRIWFRASDTNGNTTRRTPKPINLRLPPAH